jgi:hypothetical protein
MVERSVRARRASMQLYAPRETAAPAQAIERGMNQLSSAMDRMSSFFGQQARMEAEIQGAQYGAKNAPTAEQLRDAFQSGEELELPGGYGTVFDRAARKAALDITQTEIEFEARKRINDILANAKRNNTNPATIVDDIDAVTHGFAATFDDSSPGVARKLRASLSIWSNSKMASYENSYIAEQKSRSQSNFIANTLSMMEGFDDFIASGIPTGQVDPDTGEEIRIPMTTADMTALKMAKIEEARLKGLPASSLTTLANLFDKKLVDASNRVLVDSVLTMEDPQEAILNIGRGKVDGLSVATQNAVATLRGQDLSFSDIAKELRTRRVAELDYIETEQNFQNNQAEQSEEVYEANAMRAITEGDWATAAVQITLLAQTDPVKAQKLREEWMQDGQRRTVSSPTAINALQNLGPNITFQDVSKYWPELTPADQDKYFKRAETYENEEVRVALSFMKGELLLPSNIDAINDSDPNFEKVNIYRRLQGRLEMAALEAKRAGVDFNAREVAMRLLKEEGTNISEAEGKLKIEAGNNVITMLSSQGGFELEQGEFQEALRTLQKLITDKEAGNKANIPANLRKLNVAQLRNLERALKEAMQ